MNNSTWWTSVLLGCVFLLAGWLIYPRLHPQSKLEIESVRTAMPSETKSIHSFADTSYTKTSTEKSTSNTDKTSRSYPSQTAKAMASVAPYQEKPKIININTASQSEIESLPRIGPKLAERIIQARPIDNLAELDQVKGIGPKLLKTITPLVIFK